MGSGALGGAGQRPAAFSRLGSRERSGREPSRFFPFPLPWTKSMGLNSFKRPGPKTRESYGGSAPKPPGKIKRFKPSLLSAFREQQGGKEKEKHGGCSPPNPQPGYWLVAMGATARLMPRLTHCSGPRTRSVGASHTRHDTSWRHPNCPKTSWVVTFLQCTPMLSPFHIRNPCGKRESFQTRNLERFKPSLLSAFRKQQGGKEKGSVGALIAPTPRAGAVSSPGIC